jgi:glycosyltransferase involved in cell wall biosynthesis
MKILHLISSGGFFGAESVIINLAKEQEKNGLKITIGVLRDKRNPHLEVAVAAEKSGLKTKIFDCGGRLDMGLLLRIRRFLKSERIDILHSHGYKTNFYGLLSSLGFSLGRIATCHNWISLSPKLKLYEKLDKWILKSFDKIVVVSDLLKKELAESGIPKEKTVLINNGIDVDRFHERSILERSELARSLKLEKDEKVIGSLGRLSEEKGHTYLIRAFGKVSVDLPGVKLLIVGDGPLRKSLENESDALGLKGKIIFTGERTDVPAILGLIDIFVLPSLMEGLPIALLEAMASKKPIVATAVGEVTNASKGCVLLVKPGNEGELASAILELLTDINRADLLVKNAFARVNQLFSAQKMAVEYLKIYNNICQGYA